VSGTPPKAQGAGTPPKAQSAGTQPKAQDPGSPPKAQDAGATAEGQRAGQHARKRGGQPRNTNAITHGFYSDQFSADELALVAALVTDPTVDDELWAQRVVNRRLLAFMRRAEQDEPLTLETLTRVAEALAVGTGRVARLLRDRRALSGAAADGLTGAIAQALDEIANELGIDV
jgi:hypothetical protein